MKNKKLISGGILATIGFLLSPLSWWNDIFINIPIAYFGGWLVSLIYKPAFLPAFISAYWLTNLFGFLLMYFGAAKMTLAESQAKSFSKKDFLKYFGFALLYTLLMVALVQLNVVRPLGEYFK